MDPSLALRFNSSSHNNPNRTKLV